MLADLLDVSEVGRHIQNSAQTFYNRVLFRAQAYLEAKASSNLIC